MVEEALAIEAGRENELAPPVPFRDFVAQSRLGVSREEHEAFFKDMLGDVEEPTAPYGVLDVQGDGSNVEEVRELLAPELAQQLRHRARQVGVSPASVLHQAWAVVLARLTGQQDVVFGTVLFGRLQGGAQADRGMGMFINTLPLKLSVGADDVAASLQATHRALTGLVGHEHASLALAQRMSQVPASRALFTSLLNYRHSAVEPGLGDARAQDDGIEQLTVHERTNYPLTVSVDDFGEQFMLTVQARLPIDARRVCTYLAEAVKGLLSSTPSCASVDILPPAERAQVLHGFNATEVAYRHDQCLHELIEEHAHRTPQAIALRCEDRSVSYAELNAQANRLARHLRTLGVSAEQRVAVCAQRGVELVVGLLAVLKAGGAYVPLDPAYPRERLAFMLADSSARVVLCDDVGAQALSGRRDGAGRAPGRRRNLEGSRCEPAESSRDVTAAGQPGLRDLHVGLDGPAQGRGHRAPERVQPGELASHGVRTRGRRRHGEHRGRGLRCLRVGDLVGAVQRRLPAPGAGEHAGGCAGAAGVVVEAAVEGELPDHAAGGDGVPTRAGQRGGAHGAGGRRPAEAAAAERAGRPAHREQLRPHRDDGGGDVGDAARGRRDSAHRTTGGQHAGLHPGRASPTGGGGRDGRALHRRRGRGAGLPEPTRADAGTIPRRSVQRSTERAHVPHGRRWPMAGRRHDRVPGAQRLPGQDPRLPHRAGRDRSQAGDGERRAGDDGARTRRCARRQATRGVLHGRHRRRGLARPRAGEPAGLHGAGGLRETGGVAIDAQRQARSQGVASTRCRRPGQPRLRSAARPGRGDAGRDLGRPAQGRARGPPGRLLRTRRPLAAGGTTRLAGAPGARRGVGAEGLVRACATAHAGEPRGAIGARRTRRHSRGQARRAPAAVTGAATLVVPRADGRAGEPGVSHQRGSATRWRTR